MLPRLPRASAISVVSSACNARAVCLLVFVLRFGIGARTMPLQLTLPRCRSQSRQGRCNSRPYCNHQAPVPLWQSNGRRNSAHRRRPTNGQNHGIIQGFPTVVNSTSPHGIVAWTLAARKSGPPSVDTKRCVWVSIEPRRGHPRSRTRTFTARGRPRPGCQPVPGDHRRRRGRRGATAG